MSAEGESSIPKGKFQHIIKIQIKHFEINFKRYIIICSEPSRFLPQKEKGLRRGYGRSRRLRKSSGSSRSPSQSGEEYYTTDDEGKRKKHGSKDRKDKSRRGNSNLKVNNLFVGL